MGRLALDLRASCQPAWDAMQGHRFVRDIEADALPRAIFERYLIFEHSFVETAILIFGHALLKAESMTARRRLCRILEGLAGEQLDYFDRLFLALGVQPRSAGLPAAVTTFCEEMLRMAEQGSYTTIIAIMLAAEWTYATWCRRAALTPSSDEAIAAWVRLHAEPAFLDQAAWLRAELEAALSATDEAAHRESRHAFDKTLHLEIAFHHAPYEDAQV